MRSEVRKLLDDMGDAARGVTSIAAGRTIKQYRADLQLRWAVERGFEIVGEAPNQLRKLEPALAESITDWRAIINFRHLLIHGDAVVKPDKTWDIAMTELPVLVEEPDRLSAEA